MYSDFFILIITEEYWRPLENVEILFSSAFSKYLYNSFWFYFCHSVLFRVLALHCININIYICLCVCVNTNTHPVYLQHPLNINIFLNTMQGVDVELTAHTRLPVNTLKTTITEDDSILRKILLRLLFYFYFFFLLGIHRHTYVCTYVCTYVRTYSFIHHQICINTK